MRDGTLPPRQRAAIEASAAARRKRVLDRYAAELRAAGYGVHLPGCFVTRMAGPGGTHGSDYQCESDQSLTNEEGVQDGESTT